MKSTYGCNRALNVGAAMLDVIASVWCYMEVSFSLDLVQ